MSMYNAHYRIDGENVKVQFSPVINTAKKHFLFDIIFRFDKEQKEQLIDLRKSDDIDISFKNELNQNMLNIISNKKNTAFYFKKLYLRGANIENMLFEKIDEFNRIEKFDKLCIYVHTTESGLNIESGKRLRKHLTFSKEDSPIIYSSLSELITTKAVAYVHLIGIKMKKDV